MPGMDGLALLAAALELDPDLVGIMMTGQGTVTSAVDAMKIGALDYILKPFNLTAIRPVLARAVDVRRLSSTTFGCARRQPLRGEQHHRAVARFRNRAGARGGCGARTEPRRCRRLRGPTRRLDVRLVVSRGRDVASLPEFLCRERRQWRARSRAGGRRPLGLAAADRDGRGRPAGGQHAVPESTPQRPMSPGELKGCARFPPRLQWRSRRRCSSSTSAAKQRRPAKVRLGGVTRSAGAAAGDCPAHSCSSGGSTRSTASRARWPALRAGRRAAHAAAGPGTAHVRGGRAGVR